MRKGGRCIGVWMRYFEGPEGRFGKVFGGDEEKIQSCNKITLQVTEISVCVCGVQVHLCVLL